ncbi:MAG: hypothetical protein GX346_08705 [Clostridiales bacterium]|nr:hypothetical protein [Clostridiales bacterium]
MKNKKTENKRIVKGNETIFPQRNRVTPMFLDNLITSNKTTSKGNVVSTNTENVALAKKEVDSNHK